MHQTLKQNIPKLIILMLTLVLSITITFPLTTYAEDNGTYMDTAGWAIVKGGSDLDIPSYEGGGPSRTGWLVYLMDARNAVEYMNNGGKVWILGEIVSDVVYIDCGTSIQEAYINYLMPRGAGGVSPEYRPTVFKYNCPWGTPFDGDSQSRQEEICNYIEEYITDENGATYPRSAKIVKDFFGDDALELYKSNPTTTYLVLEACATHEALAGRIEGKRATYSAYGWLQYEFVYQYRDSKNWANTSYFTEYGIHQNSSYSDKADTSWVDNREIQKSCVIEEAWPGLPKPPKSLELTQDGLGRISRKDGIGFFCENPGLGMLAFRLQDPDDSTSTYDEPQGDTPAPAPDDNVNITNREEVANIVKFYELDTTQADGTVVTTQIDSFTRETTPKTITIEDEPTYKVVDWYTSNTFRAASGSDLKYSNYKSQMTSTETGDSAGKTVTIDNPETTLYVLLKATETEDTPPPEDSDHILTESQLSAVVKDTFHSTYAWSTLKGTCPGHCPSHTHEHVDACEKLTCDEEEHTTCRYVTCGDNWDKDEKGNYIGGVCNDYHEHKDSCYGYKCGLDETTWEHTAEEIANGDCADATTCTWSMTATGADDKVKFTRKNNQEGTYPKIMALITSPSLSANFKTSLTGVNEETITLDTTSFKEDYTYEYVIYRGKDQVTLNNRDDEAVGRLLFFLRIFME